jgi:hypothetical protein
MDTGIRKVTPGTVLRLEIHQDSGFILMLAHENWGTYRVIYDLGILTASDAHFDTNADAEDQFEQLQEQLSDLWKNHAEELMDEKAIDDAATGNGLFSFLPSNGNSRLPEAVLRILTQYIAATSETVKPLIGQIARLLWRDPERMQVIKLLDEFCIKAKSSCDTDLAADELIALVRPQYDETRY